MSHKKLNRWYKEVLSGYNEALSRGQIGKDDIVYRQQGQRQYIQVPIKKPKHMGPHMAVDEKTIAGDTYTILSNSDTGKIALMAKTLRNKPLVRLLREFDKMQVKSLTRDMAPNYEWLGRTMFMNARQVVDKFHVIKQALDHLQAIRIRYRQQELTKRREAQHGQSNEHYVQRIHANGETDLQLLARSRGLLFKTRRQWTDQQKQRAAVLFSHYPYIHSSYQYLQKLRRWYIPPKGQRIYAKTYTRKHAELQQWIAELTKSQIPEMMNLAYSIKRRVGAITNYFLHKETNAKAEALNSQIQKFIRTNYGVRNPEFFFYRLNRYFT